MTEERAQAIIDKVDQNKSGTMGFPEFLHIMTGGEVSKFGDPVAKAAAEAAKDGPELTARKMVLKAKMLKAEQDRVEFATLRFRKAWGLDVEERILHQRFLQRNPVAAAYLALAEKALRLSVWPPFVNFLTLAICLAGALVGVQTEFNNPGAKFEDDMTLTVLDNVVLSIFTLDIVVKMCAEGLTPLHYL